MAEQNETKYSSIRSDSFYKQDKQTQIKFVTLDNNILQQQQQPLLQQQIHY